MDLTEDAKNEIQKYYLGPFWRPFIVAWILLNWKAIYVTLFVSEEAIQRLGSNDKLSYILRLYDFALPWPDMSWLIVVAYCIALPLLVATINTFIIAVYIRPQFLLREFDSEIKERSEKIKKEKRFEEDRQALLELKEENTIREIEIVGLELTQEERWTEEYIKMKQQKIIPRDLSYIYKSIYEHDGLTNDPLRSHTSTIATMETNGIITKSGNLIALTEK